MRVYTVLAHQIPDRVPIDLWVSPEVMKRLVSRYGLGNQEELLERYHVDFRYLDGPEYIGPPLVEHPDGTRDDHFGVPRRKVSYGKGTSEGSYSEVARSPLEHATSVEEIEAYAHWPQPEWFDYNPVRIQAKEAKKSGAVVVFMGDRLNRCAQLKPAMYLRGMEQILLDLYLNPEIAKALFDRIAHFYAEYLYRTLQAGEGNIDIVFTGDDFGTQQNTFMPILTWRMMLKDGFQRFIDISHQMGCKVAHHTCGSIVPLIPEFIECGLDILNPLQPEAQGMDFGRIKEEFGRDLVFHGGISIQKTLPYGTKEDIRDEVKKCITELGHGGGYIACTAHNIQPDTPLENIEVLFEAYEEFGEYT